MNSTAIICSVEFIVLYVLLNSLFLSLIENDGACSIELGTVFMNGNIVRT